MQYYHTNSEFNEKELSNPSIIRAVFKQFHHLKGFFSHEIYSFSTFAQKQLKDVCNDHQLQTIERSFIGAYGNGEKWIVFTADKLYCYQKRKLIEIPNEVKIRRFFSFSIIRFDHHYLFFGHGVNPRSLVHMMKEWEILNQPVHISQSFHPLVQRGIERRENYVQFLKEALFSSPILRSVGLRYLLAVHLGLRLPLTRFAEIVSEDCRESLFQQKWIEKDWVIAIHDLIVFYVHSKSKLPTVDSLERLLSQQRGNITKRMILQICEHIQRHCSNADEWSHLMHKYSPDVTVNVTDIAQFHISTYYKQKSKEINTMKELQVQFSRDGENYEFRHEVQEGQWRIPHNLEQNAEVVIGDGTVPVNSLVINDDQNFLNERYPGSNQYVGRIEKDHHIIFPEFTYSDVTEQILFGFSEIQKIFIVEGIWAHNGKRTFQAVFPQYGETLRQDGYSDLKLSYSLLLKSAANELFEKDNILLSNFKDNRNSDKSDFILTFTVDTEVLSTYMKSDLNKVRFELSLDIISSFPEERYIFSFPIHLTLLNPQKLMKKNTVAIDFGTSSTCVAYRKQAKPTLLSLQDDIQSLAAYENPTNLMIHDWEAFRKEWASRTTDLPMPTKYSEWSREEWHFDQGHQLRNGMKDASPTVLKATIDELKLIPYRSIKLDKQDDFVPAKNTKVGAKQVHLVCSPNEENDVALDPIAFYGYLLGRAINRPINTEIPLEYYMTVPVKFDFTVRESIRRSLEFGIKLSLPKIIRDKANVRIGNEEPVAFIRAVIGNTVIKESGWEPGTDMPFAVFDFGGGTLDFSYGVYRNANDEELDDHDYMIDIFRTSGHEEGGAEHLIHWLSYEIYKDNQLEMKEHEICFPKPIHAEEIEFFPQMLLRESPLALTNLRYINENCSRLLFKGEQVEKVISMVLYTIDGETKNIDINVNKEELTEKLQERLAEMVVSFADELKIAFSNKDYNVDELHIFRAGNASRSTMIANLMNEYFSNIAEKNRIHFIDEQYVHGVKPKTAVALGQLSLATDQTIGIIMSNSNQKNMVPFMFNVGVIDPNEDNRFNIKIQINSLNKTWENLGRYNKETFTHTLYYTSAPDAKDLDDNRMRTFDHVLEENEALQGTFFWARSAEENLIEYIIMKPRQIPEVTVQGKIIPLPRR